MTTQQPTQMKYADEKRRQIVDACKKAIKTRFDLQCKLLKNKEVYQNGYTSEMFCDDMGKLIHFTQSQLNKLKLPNGEYYHIVSKTAPQHKCSWVGIASGYAPIGQTFKPEFVCYICGKKETLSTIKENDHHSSKCSCDECN